MFEIYKGRRLFGQVWRWRYRAVNGRIMAHSGEPYSSRAACIESLHRFRTLAMTAPEVVFE